MVQNIPLYISQLGMMVIAVGLSSYNVALFHLVNHAFYKGLLFLGAGAVIHAVSDNQDFRKYGGLISFLPLSYSVMLIASLSLVAFPFMTGFYSKDFILESAYGQFNFSSVAVYFIATIGAMFTTLYSVKVLYLTFLTNANGPLINYKKAHEGDVFMSLPLVILAVFSIFFGYITKDMFIGMASGFFSDNSLFIHPLHEIMLDTEFAVPTLFKLLPFFLTVTLSALSLISSEFFMLRNKSLINFKLTRIGYNIFSFFNQRFLIELFYNKYITRFILKLGGHTTKVLDKGSIELLGPYGLEKGLLILSKSLSSLDTGVITSYALYILIGLILYILIPYISLIDISILLLIIFGLLIITFKLTPINNIPQPHLSVLVPMQSGFFKYSIASGNTLTPLHPNTRGVGCGVWGVGKLNLNWFTFPLFISIIIAAGLYLGYRFPIHFMLGKLDLLTYYPLFNLMITLCSIIIIANLTGKQIKPTQLWFAIFFALFTMLWFLFGSAYYHELYASCILLFTHGCLIWESLNNIWYNIKNNAIPMSYAGYATLYKTTPSDLSSGGGGSSSGVGSAGGGSAGVGSSSGVGSTGGGAGSANEIDHKVLMERVKQMDKDLKDNTLDLKGSIDLKTEEEIAAKFPVIDGRDVPKIVRPYLSFYYIKSRALYELMILEACKIENSKPGLSLAWRKTMLNNISDECTDNMTKYYNTLNKGMRKSIDKTFKKKPWDGP